MLEYIISQNLDKVISVSPNCVPFSLPKFNRIRYNKFFGKKVNTDVDDETAEYFKIFGVDPKEYYLTGINLWYGNPENPESKANVLLGTFDSTEEVSEEIRRIESCEESCYIVRGYYESDDPDCILELAMIRAEIDRIKNIDVSMSDSDYCDSGVNCDETV